MHGHVCAVSAFPVAARISTVAGFGGMGSATGASYDGYMIQRVAARRGSEEGANGWRHPVPRAAADTHHRQVQLCDDEGVCMRFIIDIPNSLLHQRNVEPWRAKNPPQSRRSWTRRPQTSSYSFIHPMGSPQVRASVPGAPPPPAGSDGGARRSRCAPAAAPRRDAQARPRAPRRPRMRSGSSLKPAQNPRRPAAGRAAGGDAGAAGDAAERAAAKRRENALLILPGRGGRP